VVVGNHPTCNAGWAKCPLPSDGKEAIDRKSITLEQEDLVKQVLAANPRTVVVLISSFPFAIQWTEEHAPAILHMAHNSQEEGNALADVLFGDYNPGGRLVVTWPMSLEQLPPMMDYDLRHGRTYMYFRQKPLYPFGYGLSYTIFHFGEPRLSKKQIKIGETTEVSIEVTNTGQTAGDAVAQLYIHQRAGSASRPVRQLKGFHRVALAPGQTQTLTFPLGSHELSFWSPQTKAWAVEPGTFDVWTGEDSAAPSHAELELTAK
jgi:beta-glucosidase